MAGPSTAVVEPWFASLARPAEASSAPDDTHVDQAPVIVDAPAARRATGRTPEAASPDPAPDVPLVDPGSQPVVVDLPDGPGRLQTAPLATTDVQTIGVTWPEGLDGSRLHPRARTMEGGRWSSWQDLDVSDSAPDPGTADALREARGGTDSLWIGDADAVQLSFAADAPSADLRLALIGSDEPLVVGPGGSGGPGRPAAALPTVADAPQVYSRGAWGARAPACTPDVARTLVAAVVHHTADSNDYSTVADAMRLIRNDQAYHIDGRGWCDIGYNFLVDKWGNVYEGRANSGSVPVIGVHAGGFNTSTVGIAMLGDYTAVTPSPATQESVARVIAWRLGAYQRDPASTVSYTTAGGENSRYAAGTTLALPTVIGHRDVAYTACPGNLGYGTLGWLRSRARQLIGAGWVNPVVAASPVGIGVPVTVMGGTLGPLSWRLTVVDERTGVVMSTSTGVVDERGGGPLATWNGSGPTGAPVGPGPYRLTLTGSDPATGVAAVPWVGHVDVSGGQNPPTVAPVPLTGDLEFVPMDPRRLLDTRTTGQSLGPASRIDVAVAGTAGIPANARAVALNITAVHASTVTFVRAWPAGQPMPAASVLNTDAVRTPGAGVMVGVGGEGKVSLYNNAGSTHLVVDVFGYYVEAGSGGARFSPLPSGVRMLDTRVSGSPLTAAHSITVQVAGRSGVPADATAVVANVTSVAPSGAGNIAAYPSGGAPPGTASVNHLPGRDVSNRTVIRLGSGGRIDLALQGASADVVVDVIGWFGPGGADTFTPVVPRRAVDTRVDGGTLAAGQTRLLSLAAAALPPDAAAAVLSVAATRQSAPFTFVSVWPTGAARPLASDLNTGAGRDQANSAIVPVGAPSPGVQVYNDLGSTDLVIDVLGYFG